MSHLMTPRLIRVFSLCLMVSKDPSFLHADSNDWSDWVDAHADLSLYWAHMPFCWFCLEVVQIMKTHQCCIHTHCIVCLCSPYEETHDELRMSYCDHFSSVLRPSVCPSVNIFK